MNKNTYLDSGFECMVINIFIDVELVEVIQSFGMLEFVGYPFIVVNRDKVSSPKYITKGDDSNSRLVVQKGRFNNPKAHIFIRLLPHKLKVMYNSTVVVTVAKVKCEELADPSNDKASGNRSCILLTLDKYGVVAALTSPPRQNGPNALTEHSTRAGVVAGSIISCDSRWVGCESRL